MLSTITLYLKHKQTYCVGAAKAYSKTLERLFKFTQKNPVSLTMEDIIYFCEHLKIELPKFSKRGDWKTSYAYSLTVVKDFLKFCDNPNFKQIKIPKIKYNPYHPVSQEEFDIISDYLEIEEGNFANLQKLLLVRFLWETGCRISEILDIKWREVGNRELYIKNRKNMDGRWVFWSEYTNKILLTFIEQRRYYTGEYLFTTYEGQMSVRCVQRMLQDLGEKLGITYPLSPHCFRQGKAHSLFNKGADIKTVKEALGHKSLKSTERYLVLNKKEIKHKLIEYLT